MPARLPVSVRPSVSNTNAPALHIERYGVLVFKISAAAAAADACTSWPSSPTSRAPRASFVTRAVDRAALAQGRHCRFMMTSASKRKQQAAVVDD